MEENSVIKIADGLPKYILIGRTYYSLVIYKNEWDGHPDAWIVMYAKNTFKGNISTKSPLLRVEGTNILDALEKMKMTLIRYKDENKENPNIHKW